MLIDKHLLDTLSFQAKSSPQLRQNYDLRNAPEENSLRKLNTRSGRIDWLDLAKVIGIYLVICGHGPLLDDTGDQFVYSFHMPLFFLISGILSKPRSFIDNIVKSFKTLLVPYFLLNSICLIYSICIHLLTGTYHFSQTLSNLGAIFLGLGYNYAGFEPVSTPTWFLVSLFIIKIICQPCTKTFHYVCLSLISLILCLFLSAFSIDTVIPIDSALLAIPFYCTGIVFRSKLMRNNYGWISIVIAIFALLGLIAINHYNGRVDICGMRYGRSILLYYFGGMLGSVCVLEVCKVVGGGCPKSV